MKISIIILCVLIGITTIAQNNDTGLFVVWYLSNDTAYNITIHDKNTLNNFIMYKYHNMDDVKCITNNTWVRNNNSWLYIKPIKTSDIRQISYWNKTTDNLEVPRLNGNYISYIEVYEKNIIPSNTPDRLNNIYESQHLKNRYDRYIIYINNSRIERSVGDFNTNINRIDCYIHLDYIKE